ncbi:MAG: response regulator [Xenococcus sp. MO_188.B8]|nr:response regulator [Xenococcus sp. MO_188.B8]
MSHFSESFDLAELQLEQELRQMFEVDSQKDLETYLTCVQGLQEQSWKADIQTMYRAIHTIKGGSVTVKADGILQVATVLEDMLSELRYLEKIPALEDGCLRRILQEGGEIIASVLGTQPNEAAVQAKVEHIQKLKQQIQENYLADWNEQTQIQIEFAEQGLDLVLLNLEIAINQLSDNKTISDETIELARQVLEELEEIGQELQLASGWTALLQDASQLLKKPEATLWKVKWPEYFLSLKNCAKQGGQALEKTEPLTANASSLNELDSILDDLELLEDSDSEATEKTEPLAANASSLNELDSILDDLELLEDSDSEATEKTEPLTANASSLNELDSILDDLELLEDSDSEATEKTEPLAVDKSSSASIDKIEALQRSSSKNNNVFNQLPLGSLPLSSVSFQFETNSTENIQVPIPLAKLDRSAQSIVDTLMIARTMESFSQNLHQHLRILIDIAKDSFQYLTQLRQIQNDYTLLNDLDRRIPQNADSPTLERYRTGYITINRLLENNLRLSEIGAEAEQSAQQTAEKLQQLNKSITQLKNIVEDTRLIPFRNLTFRVRAIVRDLITRYGKIVNLKVKGEQIELDVGTTRRLEPILLHLVRNAYDHGLETPAERTTQGKSEQGNIIVTLQRYSSTYTLQLQDDGQGIDASAIQAKAEKLNLPLTRTDTPSELLSVICQAGFSSRTEVSEISGRGVGMDVVAEQIALLNGSLSLETIPGKGTTFKINFPVPHLLVPCLLIQSGEHNFAIPTEQIVTTSLWQSLNASSVHDSQSVYNWEIQQEGNTTPGLDLLGYWYPKFQNRTLSSNAVAVYVQPQPEQSGLWLLADKILGKLELKIQPLPRPLVHPKGVMGVSLQTDGSLIPVIEFNSLRDHLVTKSSSVTTPEDKVTQGAVKVNGRKANQEESQTILIVDDAALMRRRIEVSLSAYGYITHTCADGLEAWNWLKMNSHPMLLITDIEMPIMDGFTLIDRCRENNMTFPIMVVSSRLAEEWDKEAHRLGATDFLTKGFSTGELINKVNSLLVS